MLVIRRRGSAIGGTYKVYTTPEAARQGITPIEDWRQARAGDWIRTDDGWVAQVLRRKDYTTAKGVTTGFLNLPFGRVMTTLRRLDLRRQIRNMNAVSGKPWYQQFMDSMRGQMFCLYYCLMVINTGKVNYTHLGNIIGGGKNPHIRAKIYMKNDFIGEHITMTMTKMLTDKGITHEKILDDLEDLRKKATKDGNYKYALEVLDRFAEMTAMYGSAAAAKPHTGELPANSGGLADMAERFNRLLEQKNAEARAEVTPVERARDQDGDYVTDGDGNRVTEVGPGWEDAAVQEDPDA